MLKSQRLTPIVEISKFSSTNLKTRWNIQKGSIVMNYAKAKWKASKNYGHSLMEVIYAHFYNRDSPFDFVPFVYDLFESLKLHSKLWIIPHLILTHNTRDFVQIMSISFVWLYMFKCDVYAQYTCWSNPKRFLSVLYVFESDFVL